MGRGRKGILLQGRKGKKEYDEKTIFNINNAVRHQRRDILIDPQVVDYLRSLNPKDVLKTVLPATPGSL